MSLVKPQLRRLAASSVKKHFIYATIFTIVTTVAFRVFWVNTRRAKYAEFHKNYDVKADYERMVKAGVFKSVRPDGSVGEGCLSKMTGIHRLPPLPTIKDIIRLYGLRARKQLSQNFLLDMNLSRKIVRKAGKLQNNLVVEVGPGPGGITRAILEKEIDRLVVIEKDRRFLPGLQVLNEACGKNMQIAHGDILDYNLSPLIPEEFSKPWDTTPPDIHIIGNLPFNISTPLIIQWLKAISERGGPWQYGRTPLTLTFQKEVADRIVSPISTDNRCRLSIMCQYLCKVKLEFVIPGKAFVPIPKVDVGVVKFIPLVKPLIQQPFHLIEKLVRHIFHYRRKKCIRGAETLFPLNQKNLTNELFQRTDINPDTQPFRLTNEEFKKLCNVYSDICERFPGIINYDYRSPENNKILRSHNKLQTEQFEKQILYGDPEDFQYDYNVPKHLDQGFKNQTVVPDTL